jgi:hypothetical protein
MKRYTTEEIEILEKSLETMKQSQDEVKLSDLTEDNFIELKTLYDLIVGEFINATEGKDYDGVTFPELKDLTEDDLRRILGTLQNAATGLVIIAKSRIA